jgi:pimeloyl-ACP methyl ester carboxylesterase
MRVALPSGIQLHVHERGTGDRAALLVHGWAVSGHIWSDLFNKWPDGAGRLIAPDLRGTGWSSKPREGYTIDAYAEDIVGLIDALELRDLVLVGHSMGGTIALRAALERQDRLRRLVLMCPVPPSGVPFDEGQIAFFRSLGNGREGAAQTLGMMFAKPVAPDILERAIEGCASVVPEAFYGGFDAWRTANFASRMGELRVPTLMISGEKEQPLSPEFLKATITDLIAGAEGDVFAGTGHYPQLESTDDLVLRLQGWLGKGSAA